LATDGLVAEREQGITIDVAHIYFSTAKKSYIIADTQDTWSTTAHGNRCFYSQVSIILIDARKGVRANVPSLFFNNNLRERGESHENYMHIKTPDNFL
jgi:sulfate adenylyltransferase subunit 1